MQLVTDNAADISQEQLSRLTIDIHRIPLTITLDGTTYIDPDPVEFYALMEGSSGMPTTSQPSPGDISQLYRDVAEQTGDKDILSVHISSGLSGTPNAARLAADAVADEGITVHLIDTMTLGPPEGWQVEAAARALMAGWDLERIRGLLDEMRRVSDAMFTLPTLKYLIHGGRINHPTGLGASTLGIRPIIGVNKEDGKYEQRARVRTFKKAVNNIAELIAQEVPAGTRLRVQPLHGHNPEAMAQMQEAISAKFEVDWMPAVTIAPVLGAHTGSGMIGCAWAKADEVPELP